MTTTTPPPVAAKEAPPPPAASGHDAARTAASRLSRPWATVAALVIAVVWTIPTFGLFISSFRPERQTKTTGWWTFFANPSLTLENYQEAFGSGRDGLASNFVNSIVITVPAVIIPMTLALLAAYAFAWIKFPFRNTLFIIVFALQIVPIQVALLPLLKLYVNNSLVGFPAVWLSHSIFALPLAIFLLHNFMREIPVELVEAARVDGASHVKIFLSVLLPLLKPAIAAFGIFQFLWVWNDFLVGLTFAGGTNTAALPVALANLSGTKESAWHLLSAGAFISMIIPIIVFLSLQRYFVRGLLAGGLKG